MKIQIDEVIEFIRRRFAKDCDWMEGNCFWFAAILCERFDELYMWYEPIVGHFYAGDIKGNVFFDWAGAHIGLENKPILFAKIAENDDLWFSRLIRDCVK